MAQKVIDVVGTIERELREGYGERSGRRCKTVRGTKWVRVAELEMELDGKKIRRSSNTAPQRRLIPTLKNTVSIVGS